MILFYVKHLQNTISKSTKCLVYLFSVDVSTCIPDSIPSGNAAWLSSPDSYITQHDKSPIYNKAKCRRPPTWLTGLLVPYYQDGRVLGLPHLFILLIFMLWMVEVLRLPYLLALPSGTVQYVYMYWTQRVASLLLIQ